MEQNHNDILSEVVDQNNEIKRKQLLPWWIKIFTWIFIGLALVVFFGLILGVLGYDFQLGLYGLETNKPFSTIGIFVMTLFLFKGITSYGFLKEENWAVTLGIIDSLTGIFICVVVMFFPSIVKVNQKNISLRLELILLIPYFVKLIKIKSAWENILQIS